MRAPLLPLRDLVVFPHMVAPLFVGRDKSVAALEYAMKHDKTIFLATQREAKVDEPGQEDIYEVGTISTVLQLLRLPDGTVSALRRSRLSTPKATSSTIAENAIASLRWPIKLIVFMPAYPRWTVSVPGARHRSG